MNEQQQKQPRTFEAKPPDHEWTKQPENPEHIKPRRLITGKNVYGNGLKEAGNLISVHGQTLIITSRQF
jgi:hypothetical protein